MLDDLSFLSRSTSDIDLHFWVTGALALISCPLQSMFTLWKSICVVLGLLGLYPACFARINTLRSSERGCSLSTHSLVIAFLFELLLLSFLPFHIPRPHSQHSPAPCLTPTRLLFLHVNLALHLDLSTSARCFHVCDIINSKKLNRRHRSSTLFARGRP